MKYSSKFFIFIQSLHLSLSQVYWFTGRNYWLGIWRLLKLQSYTQTWPHTHVRFQILSFQMRSPTYVVKSLLLIKSLVTSKLSHYRFDGQYVPITSQISKENFEVIKRVEIKRIRLWYVLFQFYRIFEFKLILAAELGCLGKFKRSNQILQCAEQQMFIIGNARKLEWVYDTVMILLVGTSNGCLNLGRKIKIVCLSLSL